MIFFAQRYQRSFSIHITIYNVEHMIVNFRQYILPYLLLNKLRNQLQMLNNPVYDYCVKMRKMAFVAMAAFDRIVMYVH